MRRIWQSIRSNSMAMAGLIITSLFLLSIVLGPILIPHSLTATAYDRILEAPSLAHPFGTDSYGRDVLVRVLYGARISLGISITGVTLAAVLGTLIGMAAGYIGRFYDSAPMRVMDLLFAFPAFVLALFLMVILGFGVANVALAIALVYVPIFARLARNMTVTIKSEPYVQAARLQGQSTIRLLCRELLPNISAPLLVQAGVGIAFGVIIESGLSFLGLGVQPPTPSLGVIMADGQEYFRRAPWVLTLTGLFVSAGLLGINLLGDGFRDLADPRLRKRTS